MPVSKSAAALVESKWLKTILFEPPWPRKTDFKALVWKNSRLRNWGLQAWLQRRCPARDRQARSSRTSNTQAAPALISRPAWVTSTHLYSASFIKLRKLNLKSVLWVSYASLPRFTAKIRFNWQNQYAFKFQIQFASGPGPGLVVILSWAAEPEGLKDIGAEWT